VAFNGEWHLISDCEERGKFPIRQASDFIGESVKKYVAVYCATKSEWEFACNYFKKPLSCKNEYGEKGYNTFELSNKFGGWNEKEYFEEENYNVITFQDWIKKDNIPYSTTKIEEFDKAFEPEFIQGKWYVCTSDYWQETSIARYVEHDNDAFQFSEAYITKEEEEYEEDSWGMPDLKSLREATYRELCDYLPKYHPDNPLNIDKIKVGDWCEIISLNSPKEGKLEGKIGHKFQVDGFDDIWYHATTKTNINGGCWPLDCIKKIEPPVIQSKQMIIEEFDKSFVKTHQDIINTKLHYQYPDSLSERYPSKSLDTYIQTPVVYSGKKNKRKLVTIFN
jgi:hypothetical protein